MNVLLVYPKIPPTFWSFEAALSFVSKKSAEPPLGLITVASLLPEDWNLKLVDMNVSKLKDDHIIWADYVFLSGMNVQINSFRDVIRKCNLLGTKIVAGGPLATTQHQDFLGIDHFVLNEAEITLPMFLKDLENGTPQYIYRTDEFPDIHQTPPPKWELLEMNKYASMSIQYSRGCPYDCDFCSITMLNGRKPRTKTKEQFINELNILYNLGWRGGLSVVDDNFIGNKVQLKKELLPALIEWTRRKDDPFKFITEVSINLADDDELIKLMVEAGMNNIFVGIETPDDKGLEVCGKFQNRKRDMVETVHTLHRNGFIVSGGFIVGFDSDTSDIFEKQIDFITRSGIPSAMVGLLNAPTGTKLFARLKSENRLLETFSGNNMDGSINFIPKMNYQDLMRGYHKIINTIYAPKEYYSRLFTFLKNYKVPKWQKQRITIPEVKAFFKLIFKLGLLGEGKIHFWKLFWTSLIKYPKKFTLAMTLAVYGFHFRSVAAKL
ncbi:MAG: DUF4070 domain-containing protein [Melioribacteraceae bacterium]|nr:DUF4070 domain-containing protein [Melioribacteraceae bacterium]MCF8395421.1 DUF4070 domain-containing protein [Melioribacteraceae bacterium]MCF8420755.1 DUF4070 domain-containing protein [Melioribacteraceae bacterium]